MVYDNRKYVIFDVSEIDKINFDEVLETSAETLRKSVDGTKTFVKWPNEPPNFVEFLITKSNYLTHEEMLELLLTTEWTPAEEVDNGA